jgi:hypothetical protein
MESDAMLGTPSNGTPRTRRFYITVDSLISLGASCSTQDNNPYCIV